MESVYKFDGRKTPSLLIYIGNKVFKQNWKVGEEAKTDVEEKDNESKEEGKKKRRKLSYLDNQLPDRVTVAKTVEDFTLLSYMGMA